MLIGKYNKYLNLWIIWNYKTDANKWSNWKRNEYGHNNNGSKEPIYPLW